MLPAAALGLLEQDRPRDLLGLDERCERIAIFVEAHADDLEAAVVPLRVLLTQAANLGHARAAPGGPEIDQHHLPGERSLVEGLARQERAGDLHRPAGKHQPPGGASDRVGPAADGRVRALCNRGQKGFEGGGGGLVAPWHPRQFHRHAEGGIGQGGISRCGLEHGGHPRDQRDGGLGPAAGEGGLDPGGDRGPPNCRCERRILDVPEGVSEFGEHVCRAGLAQLRERLQAVELDRQGPVVQGIAGW